jgi:hypothetical protein
MGAWGAPHAGRRRCEPASVRGSAQAAGELGRRGRADENPSLVLVINDNKLLMPFCQVN